MTEITDKPLRRLRHGYRRTPEQRENDLVFCTDLFLKGYSYRQISDLLNKRNAKMGLDYAIVPPMRVYKDLKQLLINWKREHEENIDLYITKELSKLDKIEAELWDAWERSKKRIVSKIRQSGLKTERSETFAGNPRYLDLVLSVQQRRAKLLGLDAPVKVDLPNVNVSVDSSAPKYDISVIPNDMLFVIADKLQNAEYERLMIEKNGDKKTEENGE
jgi:hypothetical protein|nr:MAG: hypothetical protein [Bacteriophage sp.]UVX60166.1 MAG: hypothetical protein [Bacteriophage sp.]UVY57684.1 MAG: hypothetical protein [Bacteriophage sp.]UWF90068.1 MAG: hypothetical protein [Bacteriophage sp.]